jgi:cell shape-determining protein MreC
VKEIIIRIGILAAILSVFTITLSAIIGPTPEKESAVSTWISAPFSLARSIITGSGSERAQLEQENEKLRAQLAFIQGQVKQVSNKYRAQIYSTYPFSNHDTVYVNAGSAQGIQKNMAVTVGETFLFGQVVEVFKEKSIVRSIFDPGWQLPVKIGIVRADALLIGNRVPKLTLIVNDEGVEEGDEVIIAQKDFPFGLHIGSIANIRESNDVLVKEAEVNVPYSPAEVQEVFIWNTQ